MEKISIVYSFTFSESEEIIYTVDYEEKTGTYIPTQESFPDWVKLEHHQCEHCPLSTTQHVYCPLAANISHLAETFKDKSSISKVTVRVKTKQREYMKTTSLQEGTFSIFGLIMSLSACPHMGFLKPMARFHLPFSTPEETIARMLSLYLLQQYFISKEGGHPDLSLKQLESYYERITKVNLGMINRIRGLAHKDANVNGIVILQSFADLFALGIAMDFPNLKEIFLP